MSHLSFQKSRKECILKWNTAQDRLERLQHELKLKRKLEETGKLDNTQPSANYSVPQASLLCDAKLKAPRVSPRNRKSISELAQPNSSKIISPKKKKTSISNELVLELSSQKGRSCFKNSSSRGDAHKAQAPVEEKDIATKYKRRKRGVAAKRLEKARLQMLKAAASVSSETIEASKQSQSCSQLIIPLSSRKSILKQSSLNDEVEVDCMDVDMEDVSSCVALNTSLSNKIDNKWSEEKKNDESFFNDEIRRIRKDSAYLVRHESYIADVEMNLSVPNGDLLIVVDTNIFLSHLKFLNCLLKCTIATYNSHVLVVPWLVIQEIDYAMKKPNRKLASQAKLANYFIFECLKKEDSKFFGQSFEDFKGNFKNAVSIDDFLLQYSCKLVALRNNVVLLSDDKNLCNKCMFSHVSAYTKDEFEKTFDIRNKSMGT